MGGGIKIYCLDALKSIQIHELTRNSFPCETLFIKAVVPGCGELVVGGIYRPPDTSLPSFFECLSETLESVGSANSIILGDFNINTLNPSCDKVLAYKNLFFEKGYLYEVNLPTYQSPILSRDTSCLDHAWHNLQHESSSFVIHPNISDHYAVSLVLESLKILYLKN